MFLVLGISSTVWFLIRVIPKPSRAAYPCMQASAPIMSAFVLYLLTLFGGIGAWMKAKTFLKNKKYGYATLFIFLLLVCIMTFTIQNSDRIYSQVIAIVNPPLMMEGANKPVGIAKGIFPGRVVWVHKPGVATWDEQTGFWFEDRWNSQQKANEMIQQAITSLTGEKTDINAWKKLFSHFNKINNRGNGGYKQNEKIAIKINQNNTSSHDNSQNINASPQLVYALIRSLVMDGRIPQKNITVFDASRFITNFLFNKCHIDFPEVVFVDNSGGEGRVKSTYDKNVITYSKDNGVLARGIVTCATQADYLIDMALLKGHTGQGVTLCAKNWYGATDIDKNWKNNAHNNFNQDRDGKSKYMTFTDFMGHKEFGGKTILYLIDGLYGSKSVGGAPKPKWNMKPFNGNWPCSLLASQDPVAIDAVGIDFIAAEWPDVNNIAYSDAYLLESAKADNPPSGTFYDPEGDGIRLKSLGVFEHWNNADKKQYNKNLGKKTGIELIAVEN